VVRPRPALALAEQPVREPGDRRPGEDLLPPETATRAEPGSQNLNTTINGGTGELARVPE